jgi:hypothetical protein
MREMRIGELLDTAIKIYRQHWKMFMGLVAVILVPYLLLETFLTRASGSVNPFNPGAVSFEQVDAVRRAVVIGRVFLIVSFLFVQPILTGAVGRAAAGVYMGERPELGDMYRFAFSRFGSILWVGVLTGLAIVGGFILLIVPGILFLVRFSFGSVVVVVENERGTRAMRRSWRLATGRFWKIFGTILLAGFLGSLVGGLLALPLTLASIPLGASGWPIRAVGAAAGGIIARPFAAIVNVLLYFDLRIRKEGLDLEVTGRDLGLLT